MSKLKELSKIKFIIEGYKSIANIEDLEAFDYVLLCLEKEIQGLNLSGVYIIDIVNSYCPLDILNCILQNRIVSYYRQIARYMLRKYTKMSLASIGKLICNKDHSTVSHSVKSINNILSLPEVYKEEIKLIKTIEYDVQKRKSEIFNT